jgi:hypothetical protein
MTMTSRVCSKAAFASCHTSPHLSCEMPELPGELYAPRLSCRCSSVIKHTEVERAAAQLRALTSTHPHIRRVETTEDTIVFCQGLTHDTFVRMSLYALCISLKQLAGG